MEQNHNLIYGFANHKNLDISEWYGELAIELCRTILNWNPKRGEISTYFYLRANSMMKTKHIVGNYDKRRINTEISEVEVEDVLESDINITYENYNNISDEVLLNEMFEFGDEEIIRLRYEGYTQEEIANKIGVSQPHISRILDKIYLDYSERSEVDY